MTEKWRDEAWAQNIWYRGKVTRRTLGVALAPSARPGRVIRGEHLMERRSMRKAIRSPLLALALILVFAGTVER